MAVDDVVVNSQTGVDGNSYTTAISNDKLTNNDFLKLLLEDLKNQDPTKPMDSTELMNSQLKMSQIESNEKMSTTMDKLSASYQSSNLSTAANLIGHVIENGQIGDNGALNSYKVSSVKQENGDVIINANKIIGYDEDTNQVKLEKEFTQIPLTNITKIF